ncbi:hypothetical protein EHS25_001839 [Saitozyma podzolica]|uniref:Major facilitator superfamily (MFS) profile domain-containing protein n=1 Tax=Saitozyma podzolica TaxID=1890683 RepID=A0A427YFN9_9TREE|nr:hypothetical protein EHS25_001753 [Saitozyma podzolica]RSH89853.1 hypothetical protein EHS25_001839 [Saitozyma podzolica]
MSTVSNDQGFSPDSPDGSRPETIDDKSERDLSVLVQAPPLGAQPLDAEGDKASRPHGLLQYFGVRSAAHDAELDAIATQPSVYDKDEVAAVYLPHEKYEGLSAFDPLFRWTWREEFAVVRKIDYKIMIWVGFMFFSLNIDRGNLSQANSDNFLEDLGLTTNDFNLGNTVFLVSFLLAEIPSQLVSKRLGPDRWIPGQMCLWSIVAGAQFWLNGRSSFLVTRALLGVLQGGFIPDNILYLSYFYKGAELPLRLAWFWVSDSIAGIVAGFLAYGILHLEGYGGRAGWRWLFLFEGLLTLAIGVASFFMMPPSPTQTKAWFRPKGYFTEREEKIIVNRVLRDDPSKGDMHNRQGLSPKMLWKALTDYDMWPIYAIGLTFQVPASPPSAYFTLSLRHLGFSTFQVNLLGIPITVVGMFTLLGITWSSEYFNERALHGLICQAWCLPFLIIEYLDAGTLGNWAQYGVIGLLLSHAIQVAWGSRISNSVRTRTVSAAAYNMFVQISNIIASNAHQHHHRGNAVLIGFTILNCCIYAFAKVYYILRRRYRLRAWNAMTPEEQQEYLSTTTDEGNKRKDFVDFVH